MGLVSKSFQTIRKEGFRGFLRKLVVWFKWQVQYPALVAASALGAGTRKLFGLGGGPITARAIRDQVVNAARPGVKRFARCVRLMIHPPKHRCRVCGARYDLPTPDATHYLREATVCRECNSIKRQNNAAQVLLLITGSKASCLKRAAGELSELDVYLLESEGPIHSALSSLPGLICSEYWEDVTPGETIDGVRCEDVQRLTFPDESFDIVISQDVFEHVPEPDLGFAEILRVLRPGGYLVLTVPFQKSRTTTLVRAEIKNGRIVHHQEPVYHSDTIRPDGILVFTFFGPDLGDRLRRFGFEVTMHEFDNPEYNGGYSAVFACRKP